MKITLRDLLWLLLVVAVAASWFADRRRQAAEVQQIQEAHKQELQDQETRHTESKELAERMMSVLRVEIIRLRGSPNTTAP